MLGAARMVMLAAGCAPQLAQTALLELVSFRVRRDDGSETTATWIERAGLGTVQEVDTPFRVRFTLRNYDTAASERSGFKAQYAYRGNAWTDVTASSSVIRAVSSGDVVDGTSTTDQLGGLSGSNFVAGSIDGGNGAWSPVTLDTNERTELEAVLRIEGADVSSGDQIVLRVIRADGTPLDKYRRSVSITAWIPTTATFLSDSFSRTTVNGWGSADGGMDGAKGWTIVNGTASAFSVNGSQAVNAGDWAFARIVTGDDNSDDVDIYAEFSDLTAPGEFGDRGVLGRYSGGNDYEMRVIDVSSTTTLQLLQRGGSGLLASTGITHYADAKMRLQIITEGSDVRLRCKYWDAGEPEPGSWTLEYLHNTGTRYLSGSYGILLTNNPPTTDGKVDEFIVTSLTGALPAAQPVANEQRLYGVHHDRIYFGIENQYYLDSFNRAQAAKSQISRHGFLWSIIEPSRDTFDWTRPDLALDLAEARGMRTIFTIMGSPTWANGGSDEFDIPDFDASPRSAWDAWLADYVKFVTAAVTRYADRDILWELWNEPNLQGFWDSPNSRTSGQDKPGWMDEYKAWHDTIRAAILAIDPHARIAAPTLSTWRYIGANDIAGDVFLTGMTSRGITLDALSFHVYDNDAPDDSTTAFINHHTDIALLRQALVGYGLDNIPIWLTEFGWNADTVGEATQASYLMAAMEMIRDNYTYVEIATYFPLEDNDAFTGWGLYERTSAGSAPRPSRDAFAAFIDASPKGSIPRILAAAAKA